MKIRLTDLIELIFCVNSDTCFEYIINEIVLYSDKNINNSSTNYIDVLNSTGSFLLGENIELNIESMNIKNCSIWLRNIDKMNKTIEINFIFADIHLGFEEYLNYLQRFAEMLTKKYSIKAFYCGLEPAIDKDNQFFSDKGIGLLAKEHNKFI